MKTLKEFINEQQVNESFLTVGMTIIVAITLARYALGAFAVGKQVHHNIKKAKDRAKSLMKNPDFRDAMFNLDILITPYQHKLQNMEYGRLLWKNEIASFGDIIMNSDYELYSKIRQDIASVLNPSELKEFDEIVSTFEKYINM